jgi:hypothetical protein
MITFKGYIIEMATFTAKNFPKDGNEKFPGAGERTTYVPSSEAGLYKWSSGFPLSADTTLYKKDKQKTMLRKGTIVYFTYPAKLYNANDIDVTGRGNYAMVSTDSHTSKPDGYISISSVIKPAGGAQNRVSSGSNTQNIIANKVEDIAFKKRKNYEFVSTAKIGSTAPDLIVSVDGEKIQFEIKGTTSFNNPITFFDKSASRRNVPDIINDIANVFIDSNNIDNTPVSRLLVKNNLKHNFIGLIDLYHSYDKTIGLAGDEGVMRSGKLPPELTTTNVATLAKLRKVIIDHFADGKDNYFVVHNRSDDEVKMYFTDYGKNLLDLPVLPTFKSFSLSTYGGASSGSTRVGLKIKL